MPTIRKKSPSSRRRGARSNRRNVRASSNRSQSKSIKYSKWIDATDDHEDRPGQSLATKDHDVIRQWVEARHGIPSTVGSTAGAGSAGVLRIDFPGGYGGKRLKKVDWDEWFETFDKRSLVFLFQEHKRDGSMSTFFKLSNPD
jgi:hypothetical protein